MDEYAVQVNGVPAGAYIKDVTYDVHSVLREPLRLGTAVGEVSLRIVLARDGGSISAKVADKDGNPATEPDPSWTPLIVAPYPENPSGHLSLDGAHLQVLQTFFGTDEIAFDVSSSRFDGETRHFERFSQPLQEIIEARIWAGLHYRTADVQARQLGEKVVAYMQQQYFQPLN